MKKILLSAVVLFFSFLLHLQSHAQASAMIGIYSGYCQTAYNMKGYDPVEYAPIGIRAAGGAYGIQIGPDFWTTAISPTFKFADSTGKEIYAEKIRDTYFGGMIRAHAGDDSRDFAVILRAGIGVYFSKKKIHYSDYYLTTHSIHDRSYNFDNSIGYNGAIGFSIPLGNSHTYKTGFGNVHITLEGVFNYNPRKYNNTKNRYTSWGVQAGVCYVFFNV